MSMGVKWGVNILMSRTACACTDDSDQSSWVMMVTNIGLQCVQRAIIMAMF